MDFITIPKNKTINLNFETQTSNLGRPFRLSGIELIGDNKQRDTIYTFRYLDTYSEFFSLYFYANGNFKEISNNRHYMD